MTEIGAAIRSGSGRALRVLSALAVALLGTVVAATIAASPAGAYPLGPGYWLGGSNGAVYAEGQAQLYGSAAGTHLAAPIVGMAAFPFLEGYWLVGSNGAVYSFGSAGAYGSEAGKPLVKPIVGMAATPPGLGYWLVGADGNVFAFGDARSFGSEAGKTISAPIVGMAGTPDGAGYWLVGSNGAIYNFGDARSFGSEAGRSLVKPIVGIAATGDGHGYWLVGSNGAIYNFGDAGAYGSTAAVHLAAPIVGMATTADSHGYWLVGSNGAIYNFGDAGPYGSQAGARLSAPIVGMAGRPPLAVKVDAYVGSSSESSNWVDTSGGWQLQLDKGATGGVPAGARVLGVEGIEVSQLQTLGFTVAGGTCNSDEPYFLLYASNAAGGTDTRFYECSYGGSAAAKRFDPVNGATGAPPLPATDVVQSLDIVEPTAGTSTALTDLVSAGLTITNYLTAYSYVLAPTVSRVLPNNGPLAGGNTVTVLGANFGGVSAVRFGSSLARIEKVVSGSELLVAAPRGSGVVNVTVTTPIATSVVTGADLYAYMGPPTVSRISPGAGAAQGGTQVTITGSYLSVATAVRFGKTLAHVDAVRSESELVVTAPKGAGTIDVTVTTPYGTSPVTAACRYTYIALPPQGFWLATASGAVFAAGGAPYRGGTSVPLANRIVSVAATPDAGGYWLVSMDGTVFAFGDARNFGDLPAIGLHVTDVVAIVATKNGGGYWVLGGDGQVYNFGDATFQGDLLHIPNHPPVHVTDVVGMVASPAANGYLLIGSDGGVFAFGAVHFYGSLPGLGVKVHDITGILPAPTYTGYVLVGSDGGAFVFGSGAPYKGSLPGRGIHVSDIVGLALTPDGQGYWMAGANGATYAFGDALAFGTPAGVTAHLPVTAIAGT